MCFKINYLSIIILCHLPGVDFSCSRVTSGFIFALAGTVNLTWVFGVHVAICGPSLAYCAKTNTK